MTISELKPLLPVDNHKTDIVDRQDTSDIITQVLLAHKICETMYDKIVKKFTGPNLYKRLFDFCSQQLPYRAEGKKQQTTQTPGRILQSAQTVGVDCKHYAGFIAGIIAANERLTGKNVDWAYRFANYDGKAGYDHVFVVVNEKGREVWIDPTPILNKATDTYIRRTFDDRLMIPVDFEDRKIKKMLSHLSGIEKRQRVGANYEVVEPCGNGIGCNKIGAATDVSPLVAAAADSIGIDASKAAGTVLGFLPDGGLKDFLTDFLKNPTGAIVTLIKGRTYTSGDYKLAEMYMRNILGLEQIQRWEQVPDGYVPQAWQYFTVAFGVRCRTNDDLDMLNLGAQNYLNRNPAQNGDMSVEAAQRAVIVLKSLNTAANRDAVWNTPKFAATPYVYPIPDVTINSTFTGIHPITRETFSDGYPSTYMGTRYSSQKHDVVIQPAGATPTSLPGDVTNPQPGGGTATKQDYTLAIAGGVAVLAGGGIFAYVQHQKKNLPKKAVTGLSTGHTLLYVVSGLAALVGGYLIYRHVDIRKKREEIAAAFVQGETDVNTRAGLIKLAMETFTNDEVETVYYFLKNYVEANVQLADPVLKLKIETISQKYGIFT